MFFTSYAFVLVFLPLVLAGFHLLRRAGAARAATWWLLAASALFYASLDRAHLATLVFTIAVNYLLGERIRQLKQRRSPRARTVFVAAIGFNALLLVAFKYLLPLAGLSVPIPLGLSFFTLLQIGYHIAVYTEQADTLSAPGYALFVGYFPYVVAGPVVRRKDFPFDPGAGCQPFEPALFLAGAALFVLGIAKKLVFADNLAPDVNAAFAATAAGAVLPPAQAWLAGPAYVLQLYFDFSAYSDMAAGISAMFGFRLPRNFHSPLKATSIMDYWRRWHITVTRFFTANLYLLLTLKLSRWIRRRGAGPRARFAATVFLPMLAAFTLIGVWHGSGANFLLFGLLMAVALSVNQLWVDRKAPPLPRPLGWLLTMLVVMTGMVLDKTASLAEAARFLGSLAGHAPGARSVLDGHELAWKVAALGAVALLLPNTHQILALYRPVLPDIWDDQAGVPRLLQWRIGTAGILALSGMLTLALAAIPRAASFIYYRF